MNTSLEEYEKVSLASLLNIEDIILRISSAQEVFSRRKDIISALYRYGAVIVEFISEESPSQQLLCFKDIFGEPIAHDRADQNMIAEVAVSDTHPGYLGASNAEHFFHTDGAYSIQPPTIVALRCETPSLEGGLSKLASGEDIYKYLADESPDLIEALSSPQALCVRRAGQMSCQSVFSTVGGRTRIRYRYDDTTVAAGGLVQKGMAYVHARLSQDSTHVTFKLQHKQVLIVDNTRTLHARTGFPPHEPRKLHRLFFDGNSPHLDQSRLGF